MPKASISRPHLAAVIILNCVSSLFISLYFFSPRLESFRQNVTPITSSYFCDPDVPVKNIAIIGRWFLMLVNAESD